MGLDIKVGTSPAKIRARGVIRNKITGRVRYDGKPEDLYDEWFDVMIPEQQQEMIDGGYTPGRCP